MVGITGPIIFLVKGEKVKKSHSDEFLVGNGCSLVSVVIATENTHMNDQPWDKADTCIVKGQ